MGQECTRYLPTILVQRNWQQLLLLLQEVLLLLPPPLLLQRPNRARDLDAAAVQHLGHGQDIIIITIITIITTIIIITKEVVQEVDVVRACVRYYRALDQPWDHAPDMAVVLGQDQTQHAQAVDAKVLDPTMNPRRTRSQDQDRLRARYTDVVVVPVTLDRDILPN